MAVNVCSKFAIVTILGSLIGQSVIISIDSVLGPSGLHAIGCMQHADGVCS